MKQLTLFLCLTMILACMANAQQNISFREGKIISPQINADNSVTFRVRAPLAKSVTVRGDWDADGGRGEMKQGADSVWTYTTPALTSEMYTYRIVIDGVAGLDPTNPFVRRDVGSQFSIFFINGGAADYYQVHDVPHGTLSAVWYPSETMGTPRRMSVYTPPLYEQDKEKRYPVLYLLHGSGGDENAWVELGCIARIMDNLIAEKKAEPMIVVMPNGNSSRRHREKPAKTLPTVRLLPTCCRVHTRTGGMRRRSPRLSASPTAITVLSPTRHTALWPAFRWEDSTRFT